MVGLLIGVFVAIIIGAILMFFQNDMLIGLVGTVFHVEIGAFGNSSLDLTGVENFVFNFSMALLVLKFLKKGFDIYVGWWDGDKDSDPTALVLGFARAIIAMVSFKFLYEMLMNVTQEVTSSLFTQFDNFNTADFETLLKNHIGSNIGLAIAALVLVIMLMVLYIQFLKHGAEMFIMRLFFPVACVGLIDSDQGVFAPYVKTFFKVTCTIVVQLVCLKMTIFLLLNFNFLMGIAFCMMAFSTPKLIDTFLVPRGSSGMGSAISNVYHLRNLIKVAK